jgi:ribose/xylose/arabinose/galactoside ABC-type transport system permease subunit
VSAKTATERARPSLLRRTTRRREPALVVVTLAVFALTASLQSGFALRGNISFLLATAMPLAVVAVAQTIVMLVRGIDLSVAPVLGISAVSIGFLGQDYHDSIWAMLPLAVAIGVGLGFANGLFVSYARIPPIIATLGTYTIYGGIQEFICNTRTVVTLPTSWTNFGHNDFLPDVPYILVPGIIVTVAMALVLWRTKWGRSIYAFGANAEAAFRAGIRVNAIEVSAYTICGMLAGFAGWVWIAQQGSAGYTTGSEISIQLQAIAAALIGGTTLTGGKGGVVGSFLGAIFLTVAIQAVIVGGIPYDWQNAGVGVLLLAAILVDAYQNRQGRSLTDTLRDTFRLRRSVRPEAAT